MSDGVLVPLILGGVLTLLGVVFIGIGAVRGRMMRDWNRTTGVVVSRRTGRPEGSMRAIYPTFQWQDEQGRTHQRTSMVRASLGPKPGTHVPVRFDPDEPSRAMIDSFVQSGRILVAIGAGVLTFGLVVLLAAAAVAISA